MPKITEKSQLQQLKIKFLNTERMYLEQKETNKNLREKNKILEQQLADANIKIKEQANEIEKLKLQIEELRKMIFKRNRKWEGVASWEITDTVNVVHKPKNRNRPKESYMKEIPSEVTETKRYEIEKCPKCWNRIRKTRRKIRYIEDMELPAIDESKKKIVTKEIIHEWYCSKCYGRVSTVKVSIPKVRIWENAKTFVVYCTTLLRLSYQQTKDLIYNLHNIRISDGEVTNILTEHAEKCRWKQEEIRDSISKQKWVHFDETSWPVQKEENWNYCWIMKGTETNDVVYILWENRGQWNIDDLRIWKKVWEAESKTINEEQVCISDNYNAYKNIFKYHQLCRAHPHRKLRELTESKAMAYDRLAVCKDTYEKFKKLYEDVRTEISKKFEIEKREKKNEDFQKRFDDIAKIRWNEPEKLLNIKKSLIEGKKAYFTCMLKDKIPCDNNPAESWLRPIVLKRKNSFWSKTQRWAKISSVLNTVVLSLWRQDQKNFFKLYHETINH